ncbi:MAG: NAD(P)H nitroreductase [Actinomycetota bacterium]|nr:NAD(P)H nitroreductase [Actinomycetota bacterium]
MSGEIPGGVPAEVPDDAMLQDIVTLACRAPSIHNSQPWIWRLHGPELRLYADYDRAVPVADPSNRQLIISLGVALHHLQVAAAARGLRTEVTRLPSPPRPDHLATVQFVGGQPPTPADVERARAITERFTDRLPMGPAPDDRLGDLVDAVSARSRTRIVTLPADTHPTLAHASRISEFQRRYDATYHDELAWWTADDPDRREGIPPSSLTSASEADRVEVARDFPLVVTDHSRRPAVEVDHATVLVITGPGETTADHLACGETLSDLLLEATASGLDTCIISHVLEIEASASMIDNLLSSADPAQVLVRVGVGEGHRPPATPRRPVGEVFSRM